MNKLLSALQKPRLYTKTEGTFWDDEYISKQMLKAHLDPEFEGASRKHCFIEKSSVWIQETVSPLEYPQLLDVGCGPGLYAQRFARAGYQVTGVDFSRSSVAYARQTAQTANLPITYRI